MEWTEKENDITVIALHKCGIERPHIFELLKTIKYNEFFCVYCTVVFGYRSNKGLQKIQPTSQEMDIAPRTMSRTIKQDLALGLSNDKLDKALVMH